MLAEVLLSGKEYETLNLTDYRIGSYGQKFPEGSFSGKTLYFLFQGAGLEKWMMEAGEYTMKRFAGLYGMKYVENGSEPFRGGQIIRKTWITP